MLFDSQSKADNFIRYNSEEIREENGKAPVRSYYCEFCCGFHVTSNPSISDGKRRDYIDHLRAEKIEKYENNVIEIKKLNQDLAERLEKVRSLLNFGQVEEAEGLLEICYYDLDQMSKFNFKGGGKLITASKKVEKMTNLLKIVKDFVNSKEKGTDVTAYLSGHVLDNTVENVLRNVSIIMRVEDILSHITEGKHDEFVLKRIEYYQLLESLSGCGKKEIIARYVGLLSDIENDFNFCTQD